MTLTHFPQTRFSRFVYGDTKLSALWLVVRVYVGWIWLSAGIDKAMNPAWFGKDAGGAVTGFLNGALKKTVGEHPDVSMWYAYFVENYALPNAYLFSHLVVIGEVAVGLALILGLFVGVSAFFGVFMNFNFLFAGTVSINPLMVILQIFLILAWRTAGWIGLDRYALPFFSKRYR